MADKSINKKSTASRSRSNAFFNKKKGGDSFFGNNNIQKKSNDYQADPYEQEADKAADQVTGRLYQPPFFAEGAEPSPVSITPVFGRNASFFQPKPAFESPTELESNSEEPLVQKKEEPNIAADPQERPTNNTELPPIQREDDEHIEHKETTAPLTEKTIQAKGQEQSPTKGFGQRLSSSGSGNPLPQQTRQRMESGFGADFSKVRTHTDADAIQMSKDIGAQAFTHGNDIYFNEGKFKPETQEGDHLLAHELTHTQQQKGVQKKPIQKADEETATPPPPVSTGADGPTSRIDTFLVEGKDGQIDLRTNPKKVMINLVKIPTIKYEVTKDFLQKPIKSGDRPTDQRAVWIKEMNQHKPHIEEKIKAKANKKNAEDKKTKPASEGDGNAQAEQKIFYFKVGKTGQFLIGTVADIKNAIIIPSWNKKGKKMSYDVDHKLEYQFGGEHKPSNFWLLESVANRSAGRKIDAAIIEALKKVLKEGEGKLWDEVPITRQVLNNFDVLIKQFKKGLSIEGQQHEHYHFHEIAEEVQPLDSLEPLSETEVEDKKLRGSESSLKLFTSTKAGRFIEIPWAPGTESKTGLSIAFGKNFIINEVHYSPPPNPNKEQEVGKIKGEAFKGHNRLAPSSLTFNIKKTPAIDFGGYVKDTGIEYVLKKIFKLKGWSDIEVLSAHLDDKDGIVFSGKVISDLPFINEGTNIEINVKGNEVSLKKTFETGEIDLPAPFEMTSSNLTVEIGRRLKLTGKAAFEIKGVGEGYIKGLMDSDGNYGVKGKFEFDDKLFRRPTGITISYINGNWSIQGQLKFKGSKIHGIKSGEIFVSYANEKLEVQGKAEPTIPGVSEVELKGVHSKDLFYIGLFMKMGSEIPLLKKGELKGEISRAAGQKNFDIMAAGHAVLDIPGIQGNPEISVVYDKGGILIQGQLPFKLGKAKGSIMVGVTNYIIDENNQPTGEISEQWTPFGKGNASLELSKDIIATGTVILCPNGDIMISGEVVLAKPGDMKGKEGIKFKYDLFKVAPPPIILFGVPGANLAVQISGGARLYANLTPPRIERLMLGLNGFNLTNPNDNAEIIGQIQVGMYGNAGFELYLTLKAILTVLIAKVSGELTGSVGLDANAGGQATLGVKWTAAKGLEVTEGNINLEASVQFLAKLAGKVRVYLDLWLTTVDIWEEYLEIASVRFGPSIKMGVNVPAKMQDGELKGGAIDKKSFEYPDLESDSQQQQLTEQAVKQDEKLKPPPPPSMEEALQKIRELGPGKGIFFGKFERGTLGETVSNAIKDLNRESYYLWLLGNYPEISWHKIRAEMDRLDQIDFENLKVKLSTKDYKSLAFFKSEKELKLDDIASFKKRHERFPETQLQNLRYKVINEEI